MRSKRSLSKRQTLRRKFSILRKVREHHRDVRKAIRRAKKEGHQRPHQFASERAVLKVPTKDTEKEALLRLTLEARREGKVLKKIKKNKSDKDGSAATAAELAAARRRVAQQKKEMEESDFVLQLAKCLDMSQVLIHVVDARCPTASLSVNLSLAAEVHNLPIMIILNKHDLVPPEVAEAWIGNLKETCRPKPFDVLLYDATAVVASLQRRFGQGVKVYGTIVGLPNVGLRTVCENLVEVQGGRVSVHPSKEAARNRVPQSNEIALLTLPRDLKNLEEKLCGPDLVFRNWQFIVNNLRDVELHAEEVLRHFEPLAICLHFRMAVDEAYERSPSALLHGIAKRRSLTDIREAAKLLLVEFNTGKIRWCSVPPGTKQIREGWTVLDEELLCTQDYLLDTKSASSKAQ